jgi:putative transposase
MRKRRMLRDGALYHVTSKINNKEMKMRRDEIKELFMAVVFRAKKKYSFTLENFCVMANHYHFLIKPGNGENLSRIMQWILSRFAEAFNRRTGSSGHLWGERFFSCIVNNIQQYLRVFEYIDNNPVKAGVVKKPGDWPYSGIYHHRNGIFKIVVRPPSWLLSLFPSHELILS